MAYDKEIKIPGIGSMDMDTINSLLKTNNSRILRNGRRFDGGDTRDGTVRNIMGNERVFFNYPLSDEAVIVGSCRDEKNNGIIVFIADEKATYTGAIIEYYPDSGYVEAVLLFYNLNLSASYPVNDAFVIDDLLYWNDSNNPPRKLNIVKAKAFVNGDPGGYDSIDEKVLNLIKAPPLYSITPHYFTDTAKMSNNIRGHMFQFRYAYIYDDNERSVASPISYPAAPANDVDYTGVVVGDMNVNNCIKFDFNTGHHTVKKVVIYARDGNDGHWAEVETIDKDEAGLSDNTYVEYSFYNDRVTTVVDQELINKQQHAVPLIADSLGYLHTNQIVLGGNYEGYDNTDADIVLTPKLTYVRAYKKDTLKQTYGPPAFNSYDAYEVGPPVVHHNYCGMDVPNFDVTTLPNANNIIVITIGSVSIDFVVSHEQSINVDELMDGIVNAINNGFANYIATRNISDPSGNMIPADTIFVYHNQYPCNGSCDLSGGDDVTCTFSISIEEYNVTAGSYRAWGGFKMGARHRFGIIYYDDYGRKSFVNESDPIYLPFITQNGLVIPASGGTCTPQSYIYHIDWEIKHEAPSWATKYQWVRQANLDILNFSRYIVKEIVDGGAGTTLENKTLIDISPLNGHQNQNSGLDFCFPESYPKPYVFKKGDKIRFITKTVSTFPPDGLGCILDYELEVTILGYEVDTNGDNTDRLVVDYIDQSVFTDLGVNTLVEIYTPKKQQDDLLYYEMSGIYPIYSTAIGGGGKVHSGTIQDQDIPSGKPAKGTFTLGDVYSVPIVFDVNISSGNPAVVMLEMSSASAYFDLEVYDVGRPNVTYKNAEQKKYLSIRTSGKYFEGTEINGLSEFYADKDVYVSAENGNEITGLKEVGFTLKVLQPNKLTSFYIGRTGLQLAADANSQLMADSSETITTKTPSKEMFGTMNKESVLVVNRHLYFIDVKRGAIIRDAANGSVDITELGMKSEIKTILKSMAKNYTTTRVITSYNPKTNEVGFTLIGVPKGADEVNFGTYYFKDDVSLWSSFYNFYKQNGNGTRGFASINQHYISFIDAEIWLHEVNSLRNNFFGTQWPLTIELVFNKNPQEAKLYKTIEITGKGTWGAPEYESIVIEDKDAVGGKKQESRLLYAKFKNVKGKHIAQFLKDANTQNGVNKSVNLHTGKDVKGFVIKIELKNEDATEAFLDTVAVLYQKLQIT